MVASVTIINALVVKVDRIEQSMMRGSVYDISVEIVRLDNEETCYSYPTACCLSIVKRDLKRIDGVRSD